MSEPAAVVMHVKTAMPVPRTLGGSAFWRIETAGPNQHSATRYLKSARGREAGLSFIRDPPPALGGEVLEEERGERDVDVVREQHERGAP